MMCSALLFCLAWCDCVAQCRIGEEAAILDRHIHAAEILIDHASGADVEMPDFGVAHLMGRQAHEFFRGIDQGVRIFAP